jgi:oligopeptide transport system permease protein
MPITMSDAALVASHPVSRSPLALAWQKFRRKRSGMVGASLLALLIVAAAIGPLLSPYRHDLVIKDHMWSPPLAQAHLLGADVLGRDLLARILVGLRVSLAVGFLASSVAFVIGLFYGMIAGYAGGRTDEIMMRVVDLLYSLPFLIFVILLTVTFGTGLPLIFVAIGAVEWLTMARIVRGQALSLKQREFVEAARAIGVSTPGILWRHIGRNLLGPVIAYVTLTVPGVIVAESFLSFLGLGVQDPLTSLGTLMFEGAQQMEIAPWLLIFPAIAMFATLLAFNLLGDALRDVLDTGEQSV